MVLLVTKSFSVHFVVVAILAKATNFFIALTCADTAHCFARKDALKRPWCWINKRVNKCLPCKSTNRATIVPTLPEPLDHGGLQLYPSVSCEEGLGPKSLERTCSKKCSGRNSWTWHFRHLESRKGCLQCACCGPCGYFTALLGQSTSDSLLLMWQSRKHQQEPIERARITGSYSECSASWLNGCSSDPWNQAKDRLHREHLFE